MFKKKYNIAVMGANGMLGYDVVEHFRKLQLCNDSCIGIVSPFGSDYDISNYNTMLDLFSQYKRGYAKYDIIVNCAAMTDVTKIEIDKAYRDNAYKVNVIGPRVLAEVCKLYGMKLVHISTDYVYSEKSPTDWSWYHKPAMFDHIHAFHLNNSREFPVNIYGMLKLEAELAIASILPKKRFAILRTSWLYGMHNNKSFVHKFLKNILLWKKELDAGIAKDSKFGMPNDLMSVPTRTTELAHIIYNAIDNKLYGILPACGYSTDVAVAEDYAPSWSYFAYRILHTFDSSLADYIQPFHAADPTRPKFSRMFNSDKKLLKKLFGTECPATWQDQLRWFLNIHRAELIDWLRKEGCLDVMTPEKDKKDEDTKTYDKSTSVEA